MSTVDFILYSDGGGERSSAGAGACIVEDTKTKNRVYLSVFLGGATNNESEICGALLGFAFLKLICRESAAGGLEIPVHWVCDSEYVLKSGTEYIHTWQKNGWRTSQKKPVKNQGLWKAYLALTKQMRIRPEHVAAHQGHPENEACDLAACWLQTNGEDALCDEGDGSLVSIGDVEWVLIDGRTFLMNLRDDNPDVDNTMLLLERLEMLGISSFSGKQKGSGMRVVLKKIEAAKFLAESLTVEEEQAVVVVKALEQLLSRIATKK